MTEIKNKALRDKNELESVCLPKELYNSNVERAMKLVLAANEEQLQKMMKVLFS